MKYIILLSGMPVTGKTTFAKLLSSQLEIPMVSKDSITELLYDSLGFNSRDEKTKLKVTAAKIMCYYAKLHLDIEQPVILDHNFENESIDSLKELISVYNCDVLTIQMKGDMEVIYHRVIERDQSPSRHRGHLVNTRYPETGGDTGQFSKITLSEFKNAMEKKGMFDLPVGGKRILVDTTDFERVSYDKIIEEIRMIIKEFQ